MIDNLKCQLHEAGFDLCHPIHTSWYNDLIRDEGHVDRGALKTLPVPPASITDEDGRQCNAVLIGNTKHIWPLFIQWLVAKVEQAKAEGNISDDEALDRFVQIGPFDTFVEESLSRVMQSCCAIKKSCEVFWSNGKRNKTHALVGSSTAKEYHCFIESDDKDSSFLVSMQRVAKITGKYWHDEAGTRLCVHPIYGTWTAFRAVVVFEADGNEQSPSTPPIMCPCPVSNNEIEQAKDTMNYAIMMSASEEHGYGAQTGKTWPDLCKFLHGTVCSGSAWEKVPETMKPWIKLRDCITNGREEWKYDDAQLLYHYTKDPELLRNALSKLRK
eukprot:g5529.t1 g5529   contig2:711715-712698(+)